jgi:hypothetical protein
MTTATVNNSHPMRKQLSHQLDRLDNILDGLSEALSGAVADATREGTRLALKDAIIEILTDPNLRSRLHRATAPEPVEAPRPQACQPGFWARVKAKASQAMAAVGRLASKVVQGTVRSVQGAVRTVQGVAAASVTGVRTLGALGSLKKLALVGLGVGVAVGVACFLAPHAVAAAVSGISGVVAASAIQVGVWTRRAFRALTLA